MDPYRDTEAYAISTYRGLGGMHLLFGAILLGLGVADTTYTWYNYGNSDCEDRTDWPAWKQRIDLQPCNHDYLIFTYVSAPIWSGFFMGLCGAIGLGFRLRDGRGSWRRRRSAFGIFATFVTLLFAPLTVIFGILESYYGVGLFYEIKDKSGDATQKYTLDSVKFALPILGAVIGFLECCLGLATMIVVFRSEGATSSERKYLRNEEKQRHSNPSSGSHRRTRMQAAYGPYVVPYMMAPVTYQQYPHPYLTYNPQTTPRSEDPYAKPDDLQISPYWNFNPNA